MIYNCDGCISEFEEAIYYQDKEGFHFASSKNKELFSNKHFELWIVDDYGKEVVW